jgi:hypothetical protein
MARSTLRFQSVPREDSRVIPFVHHHLAIHLRHGLDLLYVSARHRAPSWDMILLWRVKAELRVNLPGRGQQWLPA